MLLFKGFTSDLVTLKRWQFQPAAPNGFVKHLIEGKAQRVYALYRVRVKDNALAIMGKCAVLHQVGKWILRCVEFAPSTIKEVSSADSDLRYSRSAARRISKFFFIAVPAPFAMLQARQAAA